MIGSPDSNSEETSSVGDSKKTIFDENSAGKSDSGDVQSTSDEIRPTTRKKRSRRIQRRDSHVFLPRLIKRDYPYDQSSNRVRIVNKHQKHLVPLLIKDSFHVLLRVKWYVSLPLITVVWYAMIWIFAFFYMWIDGSNFNLAKDCGLGEPDNPIGFATAYAFSLETCTTVGCEYCID